MPNFSALLPKGYCISPNNICGCPGVMIYPAGPGVPEPVGILTDINLRPTGEVVIGTVRPGQGMCNFQITHHFTDAQAFLAHCETNGQLSEPGMPAYAQNWD